MYFWNTKALKQKLADGTCTDAHAFPYFLATFTLITAVCALSSLSNADVTVHDKAYHLLSIPITLLCTYQLWRLNGGAGGHDFFIRYFPLGWVLLVRLFVLEMIVFLAIELLIPADDVGAPDQTRSLAHFFANTALLIGYYVRLGVHISDLAALKQGEPRENPADPA